jgi:hypothetical protein
VPKWHNVRAGRDLNRVPTPPEAVAQLLLAPANQACLWGGLSIEASLTGVAPFTRPKTEGEHGAPCNTSSSNMGLAGPLGVSL